MKGSVKKFLFIYNYLRGFFIMKVVENSPQNARNCTILKNAPKPPWQRLAASQHVYPKSTKFYSWALPPEKSCIRPSIPPPPPPQKLRVDFFLPYECIVPSVSTQKKGIS